MDGTDYELMCYKDYPYYRPYARFYNKRYIIKESFDALYDEGPFVDILPLDEACENVKKTICLEKKYLKPIRAYRRCLHHLSYFDIAKLFIRGEWYIALRYFRRNIDSPYSKKDVFLQRFIDVEDEVRNVSGKYYHSYYHCYSIDRELFDKSFFETYELLPFEDIQIRVPGKYKEYLTQLFDDYMKLPPREKRKSHYDRNVKLMLR